MGNHSRIGQSTGYLSQLLILIGIAILSSAVTSYIAISLINQLYGFDFEHIAGITNMVDPTTQDIAALKIRQGFLAIGVFLIPALLAPKIFNEPYKPYLKLKKPNAMPLVLSAILAAVILPFNSLLIELSENLALLINSTSLEALQKQQEETMKVLLNMSSSSDYLLNILLIAVIPAVTEEFLFRGAAMSLFNRWMGNHHIAIIIQGLIFGAIHQQIHNIIPLAFLGIILGYVVYHTGSIWTGILIHFINNGLAVSAFYFFRDGSVWEDILNDNFPVYISIVSMILSASIFYLIWKNRTKEEQVIEIE